VRTVDRKTAFFGVKRKREKIQLKTIKPNMAYVYRPVYVDVERIDYAHVGFYYYVPGSAQRGASEKRENHIALGF
jgi:hypothetical protein